MTNSSFASCGTVTKLGRKNAQISDTTLMTSCYIIASINHLNSNLFEIVNKISITQKYTIEIPALNGIHEIETR